MLYINTTPNENGGYNPLQSDYVKGLTKYPDELVDIFTEYNGFVVLTIEGDTVTAVTPNIEAWEVWKATRPTETDTSETDTTDNDTVTWSELDTAYSEGVNSAYEQ